MHCITKTKTNSWKIWHIILCTLLFSILLGPILYFLFKDGAHTIFPMIILPLPALLIKLFMQDKMKYHNYILILLGFAASLIAADILVYYIIEYGKDTMYFIMWKNLICLVCGMTMLESAMLFPAFLSKSLPNRIMVSILYIGIAILTISLTFLAWWLTQIRYTASSEVILIVSTMIFAASTAITLVLHNKSLKGERLKTETK